MIKELTMEKTSLPAGWEMKKLIELGEVQTGTTPSTSNKGFYGDFIPFVKPPHFNPDGTISFSSSGLSAIGLAKGRLIKENSILMVCIGASIGKTGITPIPISCNQQINAFSPNENCLPKFYYHLLSSDYFFKKVMKRSSQATLPMINKTKWQNIEIPLPPLPQQKQIVTILDKAFAAIDAAKANAEQNLQNAKELFESYLQNVFENKGDDWEEKNLGEVCDLIKRGSQPKYTENKDGEIVLNQKCIRDHKINFSHSRRHDLSIKSINEERYIQLGDGLINSTGTGTLGRVAQVRDLNQRAFVDTHITIVRPKKELFYLDFFGWALIYIEKIIEKSGEGASGQTELSRKLVEKFVVSFPKEMEQQKQIVLKLDSLSEETKKLEAIYTQKVADLDEMKKSVLQKAFSGQLNTIN